MFEAFEISVFKFMWDLVLGVWSFTRSITAAGAGSRQA
jgi:hypothetical protein